MFENALHKRQGECIKGTSLISGFTGRIYVKKGKP